MDYEFYSTDGATVTAELDPATILCNNYLKKKKKLKLILLSIDSLLK